jgi:hypothetical protein
MEQASAHGGIINCFVETFMNMQKCQTMLALIPAFFRRRRRGVERLWVFVLRCFNLPPMVQMFSTRQEISRRREVSPLQIGGEVCRGLACFAEKIMNMKKSQITFALIPA